MLAFPSARTDCQFSWFALAAVNAPKQSIHGRNADRCIVRNCSGAVRLSHSNSFMEIAVLGIRLLLSFNRSRGDSPPLLNHPAQDSIDGRGCCVKRISWLLCCFEYCRWFQASRNEAVQSCAKKFLPHQQLHDTHFAFVYFATTTKATVVTIFSFADQ